MNKHDTGEQSKTNWDLVDKLTDADLIDEALPELDETFWQEAVFAQILHRPAVLLTRGSARHQKVGKDT